MRRNDYRPGDWVIYRKTKHSDNPGPRAVDVAPSRGGDTYSYVVDKCWIVLEVRDEELLLVTRTGKQHTVPADDPNLQKPGFWGRFRHRNRFRAVEQSVATPEDMAMADRAAPERVAH